MSITSDWTLIRQYTTDCFNSAGGRAAGVCMSIEWGPQIGTPSGTITIQAYNPTPEQMVVVTAKAKLVRSILQQYPDSVTNNSVRVIWANSGDPNIDCPPVPPGSPNPLFDPLQSPPRITNGQILRIS